MTIIIIIIIIKTTTIIIIIILIIIMVFVNTHLWLRELGMVNLVQFV